MELTVRLLPLLKTKADADHAGLSQELLNYSPICSGSITSELTLPNNNSSVAQQLPAAAEEDQSIP